MKRHLGWVAGARVGTEMTTRHNCDFCTKGHVNWRVEQLSFRQSSDKGYVYCRVELPVGTCDNCGSRILQPDSDALFNQAFQHEYDKLP